MVEQMPELQFFIQNNIAVMFRMEGALAEMRRERDMARAEVQNLRQQVSYPVLLR